MVQGFRLADLVGPLSRSTVGIVGLVEFADMKVVAGLNY